MSLRVFVEAAFNACVEVEQLIRENSDESAYALFERGAGGDVSIGYDLMAEEVFIRHLGGFGAISSEESGMIGEGEDMIVIDPVDGSDNLKSHFPYYGASIALQKQGETVAALVCNFANGDCFIGYGDHHYLTSLFNPSRHEDVTAHRHTKIGLFERAALHPEISSTLMRLGLKFRSPGAVALSLSYAHYVNYVAFFGTMRPYDLEAGLFLCKDLNCYHDDNLLIVSKDETVFDQLLILFQRESK